MYGFGAVRRATLRAQFVDATRTAMQLGLGWGWWGLGISGPRERVLCVYMLYLLTYLLTYLLLRIQVYFK